ADTWTLELEPAGGVGVGPFAPGQFSMLYAFGAGEVPISVSGGGQAGGRVGQTIRAVGAAPRALFGLAPTPEAARRGPFGPAGPAGGRVAVVAGGLGPPPLPAAGEHLIAHRASYRAVAVLYGARAPDEILWSSELQAWREAGIEVETTVDSASGDWGGRVGLV